MDKIIIKAAKLKENIKIELPWELPNNATLDQYIRVVVKYLKTHPESLDVQAAALIQTALKEAIPLIKKERIRQRVSLAT